MPRSTYQKKLFDTGTTLPNGFVYRPDFLTKEEEKELLDWFEDLPFEHPVQEGYEAKRRVISFGWSYDFVAAKIVKGPPLPPMLVPIARKIAKWLDIQKDRVVEALVTEYPESAAIGWHRDNESFESIIGISLGSWCRMRLRPRRSRFRRRTIADVVSLELEPRSAYLMQKESRWDFHHSIPAVPELRYSITFRTLPKGFPVR